VHAVKILPRVVTVLWLALLASLGSAARALAQGVAVSGVVRDSAAGQPLLGAIVTLGIGPSARVTRTDDRGAFAFANITPASYALGVRRLGYQPTSQTVDVTAQMSPIAIALSRVAMLDTVRVRATAQGIYGGVGGARDLRPLTAARIQVIGATGKLSVDSTGHFFVPIKTVGAYVVRAEAPGYAPQTVSVTVRPGEGVEAALLLDSATTPASHALAAAFADFNTRMLVRKNPSAIVPRSELTGTGYERLLDAVLHAPSFTRAALRIGPTVCVFVDGRPRAGTSLLSFESAEIEAVEAYPATSDASETLAKSWPRGFPCADTGLPKVGGGRDLVQWVVVWLKS
jgi:hypothetical protein